MLVQRAKEFAKQKHEGQLRKGGEPFFNHVDRVAKKVRLINPSAPVVAAAYLHDVVEDEHATLDEISHLFGGEVYKLVKLLTRRETESYAEYVLRIAKSGNVSAMQIKIADNEDNISSVGDGAFSPEVERSLAERWEWSKDFIKRHMNHGE